MGSLYREEVNKYKEKRLDTTLVRPPGKGKHKKPRPWKVVCKSLLFKKDEVCYDALTKEAAQAWIDKRKRSCPLFEHWPESVRLEHKKRWEQRMNSYRIVGPDT